MSFCQFGEFNDTSACDHLNVPKSYYVFGSMVVSYIPGAKIPQDLGDTGKWSNSPGKMPARKKPSKPVVTSLPTPASTAPPPQPLLVVPANNATSKSWAQLTANTIVSSSSLKPQSSPMSPAFTPNSHPNIITPRGLVNHGNMCFMNVILQPLLFCNPFYHYFISQYKIPLKQVDTPLIDAMIVFLNEFHTETPGNKIDSKIVEHSNAFAPKDIYDILRTLKKSNSQKGRQEDAEEFLGFLLDGLHEELILTQQKSPNNIIASPTDESDSWVEVGHKNRTISTRSTEIISTHISKLFNGKMRSVLKYPGSKMSVTLEPFSTLQLGITHKNVHSIEEALVQLNTPEILEDFTSSKGEKVDASKQSYIESLPPVLILHLKRFIYNNDLGSTQKVHKHISFHDNLKINNDIITSSLRSVVKTDYTLFAVIFHHGKIAAGGHYTVDIKRQNKEWLCIDDDIIRPIAIADVLKEYKEKQAYMLFYRRST